MTRAWVGPKHIATKGEHVLVTLTPCKLRTYTWGLSEEGSQDKEEVTVPEGMYILTTMGLQSDGWSRRAEALAEIVCGWEIPLSFLGVLYTFYGSFKLGTCYEENNSTQLHESKYPLLWILWYRGRNLRHRRALAAKELKGNPEVAERRTAFGFVDGWEQSR